MMVLTQMWHGQILPEESWKIKDILSNLPLRELMVPLPDLMESMTCFNSISTLNPSITLMVDRMLPNFIVKH